MVIFEETKDDVSYVFSLFSFIILVTIWAALGVLSNHTGDEDSIFYAPFFAVFVIGCIWGILFLIINTKRCISDLNKKTFIFDDHSFTIKHFIFKKRYEYSGIQNVSIHYEYIALSYMGTSNTIITKDYKIAYNVVAEIEKHLKAGDQTET